MKAQVMASKGILVSDPSLKDMTPTRWAFEYAGIISNRNHAWRTTTKTVKDAIVHFLGLDILPPGQNLETGVLSPPAVPYLPLTAFMNPKMFYDTMKKKIEFDNQQRTEFESSPSTATSMGYDEMVNNFAEIDTIFDEIFDGVEGRIYDQNLQTVKKTGLIQEEPGPNPEAASIPVIKRKVRLD